ncbi:MAG: endonuclease domain-containing protein [Prevotella sp.]|nr:endonuclease domain-containing protein [Prevotella sp.]MBQ3752160.1 endonuclease domain-containing protein [Prevotella sp.]
MTDKDFKFKTADPCWYEMLKAYAKENRKKPTEAEAVLWEYLKERQLGQPFRRQHIIGDYIADFVCIPSRLVIEIDGGYHSLPEQQKSDEARQQWLEQQGFTVVRFTNEEVIGDINKVIETIEEHL